MTSELPDHHSGVRSMVDKTYRAYRSLEAAREDPDTAVVMEGDWGGSVYLTCPVRLVRCDATTLEAVLAVLDKLDWDDPEGARVYYEHLPAGSGVAGGTGGGIVVDGVWVNPHFKSHRAAGEDVSLATALADVVLGRRTTVPAVRG